VKTSNSLRIVSVIVAILTELVPQFSQYGDEATGLVGWENGGQNLIRAKGFISSP
jgi:hypothetical protein